MSEDTVIHHYPADLMQLLIDTIPKLVRSKEDVLLFFSGAGVDESDLAPLRRKLKRDRESINKYEMTRTILSALNARGDARAAIRALREIVRRVHDFEDFSRCYANDRLVAEGLVARVRSLVGKKDAFTRMQQAHDAQVAKNAAEYERKVAEKRAKDADAESVRRDLAGLFSITDPWTRGKALEGVLNRAFKNAGISLRDAFCVRAKGGTGQVFEQIDGVIALDGDEVLCEMKWESVPLGRDKVAEHCMRVFSRPYPTRGLLISHSRVTEAAVEMCREHLNHRMLAICELRDIVMVIDQKRDLAAYLRDGFRRLVAEKRVVFPAA